MFSNVFLAQTSQETEAFLPERLAYMALHFSPYSTGLSNAPRKLPSGSILLLDDSMEPNNHDPQTVTEQLKQLVSLFSPKAILLDFQRPRTTELENMAACILQALPCPVAATECYAKIFGCPVFLPSPSVNKPLENHIRLWKDQGIYLEIAPECVEITVTENGSAAKSIPTVPDLPLEDKRLHCHYNVAVLPNKAVFTICRYKEDLQSLIGEAESFGVLGCIGLYRELTDV